MSISRGSRGFTLVEVVVVVAILGIGGSLFAVHLGDGVEIYGRVRHRQDVIHEAALAVERIRREVREVLAAADLGGVAPGTLVYTPPGSGAVTWTVTGGTLTRNGRVAVRDVTAFSVSYRRRDGTPAAAVADIFWVHVTLTVSRQGETVTVRGAAHPRSIQPHYSAWVEE